jgi:ketosteroid isomerase-like protein
MKKAVLIVGAGLCFCILGFAQQAKNPSATPPKSAAAGGLASALEGKIRKAWQDWKNKDRKAVSAILADDAVEVEADGRGPRDKEASLADMANMDIEKFALSDFKILPLGGSAALATYKVVLGWTAGGQKMRGALAVTEVWVKRGIEWKLLHYQETEMK